MALRWIEGFEAISLPDAGLSRLYPITGGVSFTAEDGVADPGLEALSQDDGSLTTPVLVPAVTNSWIFGIAFRPDDTVSIEDASAAYVSLENTDGEQMRLEFAMAPEITAKPGGRYYKIRAMRGVTELCSSIQFFSFGDGFGTTNWVYFEFKVTIDNAVGSVVGRYIWANKPKLNPGGAHTTLTWDAANTNIDTQNQTSTGADRSTLSWDTGNATHEVAFDDWYICDTAGVKNNDYLGKVSIWPQKPSTTGGGDGDTVAWTLTGGAASTEDALGEPVGTINTTEDDKRVTSDVITQVHLHVVNALSPALGVNNTIIGIRHDIHGRMETVGDLDLSHMFRKTTGVPAQTNSGLLNVNSTAIEAHSELLEDDPNTATDWVYADLASYQYGVRNDG